MVNDLIDKLRGAKTLADADPILKKLGANKLVGKLVEASIFQRLSNSSSGQEYGMTMLNEAIQYLEDQEKPAVPETPGVKPQGDKFVKEETLDNYNSTTGNSGSEQSTENVEPYSSEGKQTGDEDMTNAPDTTNQMSEVTPVLNNEMHPDIAKQIGAKMPTIPPMNAGDQIKQTRYTMEKYHETIIMPLLKHSKMQDAAIKKLSDKIRETEAKSGTYSLDMDVIKKNSPTRVRATTSPNTTIPPMEQLAATRIQNKDFDLNQTRNKIRTINNLMSN